MPVWSTADGQRIGAMGPEAGRGGGGERRRREEEKKGGRDGRTREERRGEGGDGTTSCAVDDVDAVSSASPILLLPPIPSSHLLSSHLSFLFIGFIALSRLLQVIALFLFLNAPAVLWRFLDCRLHHSSELLVSPSRPLLIHLILTAASVSHRRRVSPLRHQSTCQLSLPLIRAVLVLVILHACLACILFFLPPFYLQSSLCRLLANLLIPLLLILPPVFSSTFHHHHHHHLLLLLLLLLTPPPFSSLLLLFPPPLLTHSQVFTDSLGQAVETFAPLIGFLEGCGLRVSVACDLSHAAASPDFFVLFLSDAESAAEYWRGNKPLPSSRTPLGTSLPYIPVSPPPTLLPA
eukprot:754994-Hanusia_phi.AAC.18